MKKIIYWRYIGFTLKDYSNQLILFFFLLIASSLAYGQSLHISGSVIDTETEKGLPFAHILYEKKNIGTVSDSLGRFKFTINKLNENDSLKVSYVGYKTRTVALIDLQKEYLIKMEVDPFELSDVTVTPISNADEVLERIVEKYHKRRRTTPHIARAYYDEKVRQTNELIFLAQSIGFSVYSGDSAKWTPLARQNFFCDLTNLTYSDKWQSLGREDMKPPLGNYVFANFVMYVENYGVLSKSDFKKYRVAFEKGEDDPDAYIIHFRGNGEKGLLRATSDFQVVEIHYKKTNKIWSSISNRRLAGEAKVNYSYFEETPFVEHVKIHYETASFKHTIRYKSLLQKYDYFDITNDQIGAMQRYARNPLIKNNSAAWKAVHLPYDSDFTDNLSDKQLNQYTGKGYYQSQTYDLGAIEFINSLKKLF